ncbi:ATP-dependent zinc protease family protein [Porticoccus sp.]
MLVGCAQVQPQTSPSVQPSVQPEEVVIEPQPSAPPEQVCPLPPPCTLAEPVECPPPKIIERVIVQAPPLPKTGGELNLPIIGEVEDVLVDPPGVKLEARIDTGAASSSIHAESIQLVERDGKRYVRFSVLNPQTKELLDIESKLHRIVRIKQQTGEFERRYVVKLWLSMGEIKEHVDVTLTDRSDFEFPLLVGRNLLTDTAIVDVSRKHTLK